MACDMTLGSHNHVPKAISPLLWSKSLGLMWYRILVNQKLQALLEWSWLRPSLAEKVNLYHSWYMLIKVKMITSFKVKGVQYNQVAIKWLVGLWDRVPCHLLSIGSLFLDDWALARTVARSAFMSRSPFCWANAYPSLPPLLFCSWTGWWQAGWGQLVVILSFWLLCFLCGQRSLLSVTMWYKDLHFWTSGRSTHMHLP